MSSDLKVFIQVFVFLVFVGVLVLLIDSYSTSNEKIVVVPTCAELDKAGYDGLYSCIDQNGEVVRPGEN